MLTQPRARSIVLASSGFSSTRSAKTNRAGVYAFDVCPDQNTATLVIDSRALTQNEMRFLRKRFSPYSFEEYRDVNRNEVVGFRSPFNFRAPRLSGGRSFSGSIRSQTIPLFLLNTAYQWAIPAAFLDIRPRDVPRSQAIDLYLAKGAPSNHERLTLLAQA